MSEPKSAGAGGSDGGRPRALPRLRLTHREDGFLVTADGMAPAIPPGAAVAPAFEPFRLPKMPKSMADQLVLFGDLVWRRHGRCVAVLLLMDPATRRWSFRVPAQRCGPAASCWSASAADVPRRARGGGPLLAGSYQTRLLAGGEAPGHAPPPHDGVHVVHQVGPAGGPGPQSVSVFLTAGGRMRPVAAEEVLLDDLEAGLEECLPRLTFM